MKAYWHHRLHVCDSKQNYKKPKKFHNLFNYTRMISPYMLSGVGGRVQRGYYTVAQRYEFYSWRLEFL